MLNPLIAIDFYKADHISQYPEKTEYVYSNFTARKSRLKDVDSIVFFGLQYFIIDYLLESFNHFFLGHGDHFIREYTEVCRKALGKTPGIEHFQKLKKLGYLPIEIKALPEGSIVPIGVPFLTVKNTHPDFFWLTNFIESVMSTYLWKPITSATIAYQYRKILNHYATQTAGSPDDVDYQAHDFSYRGMSGVSDAASSGAGHLTCFKGTDTMLALYFLKVYYGEGPTLGFSVPATEHSVMCAGEEACELDTYKRLLDIYPSGPISIVSDTWDYWKVIGEYLPILKDRILKRIGKVIIRPDSGDPYKIIVGDSESTSPVAQKGTIEALWDIFGGKVNSKGYKVLNPSIGAIYGDSITLERADSILKGLQDKGFCSTNIVFGVGSYTYQYVTRDSLGFAMKATWVVVDGKARDIYKSPKTDNGEKKSARGLLRVEKEGDKFVLYQNQTEDEEHKGELKTVFKDGQYSLISSFQDIRDRLRATE